MAHEEKDNKAHYTTKENEMNPRKKGQKRPSKERAPFGENNGTVQHRTINPFKGEK